MPTTFISYRRDDAAGYAGRLHEALENRLGRDRVFRDVDTLEPGQDFVEAIESRLAECRVFIAMIGREWLDARDAEGHRRLDQPHDYVRLELVTALERRDVRVIPVLIEGATMPPVESLPEPVRPLARKQAVHLRDDAWDHDVDRLASAIADATATSSSRPSATSTATPVSISVPRNIKIGAAVAVVVLLAFMFRRDSPPDAPSAGASSAVTIASNASRASTTSTVVRGKPYGVDLPKIAEVAHRSLIYTILSASVVPLGNGTSELRLRVRFSNEGRYDANAWDDSFRLVVGGNTLAPTSRLNELAHGHSLTQGIVTFEIPANAGKATLQVIEARRTGELPLDLSVTSRPADDEKADAGGPLSRATTGAIAGTPVALVRDGDLSVAIESATSRRFVNVVRLRFGLRFTNTGRYGASALDATLRIAAGDEVLAPIDWSGAIVEGNSNTAADVEFEVPPAAKRVVLRGTIRNSSGEWPFAIP
ncbi:MAG TPA: toll/interleukin-1 receptor domain-containing protein [Vicinamibacterales bacterium]|nr:toll/interleukin-1 receptor domain-containing protein [Vicinamibacterales bacterium]